MDIDDLMEHDLGLRATQLVGEAVVVEAPRTRRRRGSGCPR
jgi:hypothetical protein